MRRRFNGLPQRQQVVKVPLQFIHRPPDAGGTRDHAGARGVVELLQGLFEFLPVFALDAATHATAAWVVGHQNHVAASQADVGGERSPLVAALFFFNLNQQRLPFFDRVLNTRLRNRHTRCKVLPRNFFKRQKAVPVFAVINKTGFK